MPYDPTYPSPIFDEYATIIAAYIADHGPTDQATLAALLGIPPKSLANRYLRHKLAERGITRHPGSAHHQPTFTADA